MLGLKAILNVIDNSGATQAELINVYKCKIKRPKSVGFGTVGDEIKVVIKKARPITNATAGAPQSNSNKLRKGDMARAVIVRTRKQMLREDGRYIRFDDSACVLLNNKGEMMGSRITGPVSAALRNVQGDQPGGRWAKILAVAPKVV